MTKFDEKLQVVFKKGKIDLMGIDNGRLRFKYSTFDQEGEDMLNIEQTNTFAKFVNTVYSWVK